MSDPVVLSCWVVGDDREEIGLISMLLDDRVYALQEALKEEYKLSTAAKKIALWKLDIPMDTFCAENYVLPPLKKDEHTGFERMIPISRVSRYFPTPHDDHVHFIVVPPKVSLKRAAPSDNGAEPESKRMRNVEEVRKMAGPSTIAMVSVYKTANIGPDHKLLNLRPAAARGPPVTILHSVFGEFIEDFHDVSLEVSADMYRTAIEFCKLSCDVYENDTARKTRLRPLFSRAMGTLAHSIKFETNAVADDVVTVAQARAASQIYQYKNEMLGPSEPYVQASLTYAKYWPQAGDIANTRRHCHCPTFILLVVGPWICILGAVWLQRPVIEPLTPFIMMADLPNEHGKQVGLIAKLLRALKNGHDRLATYYGEIIANIDTFTTTDVDKETTPLPYLDSYPLPSGEKATLVYEDLLSNTKLVWTATSHPTEEKVAVKFTKSYNVEAHRLLESLDLAPNLHYVSPPNGAGWLMVVTEYVDALVDPWALSGEDVRQVYGGLEKAVDALHADGLVFGDLRFPNILIQKTAGDIKSLRVLLIDFDMCGKDGVARYPMNLNEELGWPDGVAPNSVIEKEHDKAWLKRIYQALNGMVIDG
ncbi:hypothetical protein BD410DRAFT_789110 [Rickenella mellea]|uniref:Protein kinase domain-containing protein n=1 Tax=Rickenella mellea TaxID=50990 RepID=A0A4Y7Q2Z5_9AGAM|nr:hypothetical protein BD410DRAFT_789110 [Rickenella mellea]